MKRSPWITGIIVLQLLYVLVLAAIPVYLLVLTWTSAIRSSPDAAEDIPGLRVTALIMAGPVLVALVAWFGLWKEKLWGWWAVLLTDVAVVAVFVYSMIDDGWKNLDWDMVALVLLSIIPVVVLLLRPVRRFYWSGGQQGFSTRTSGEAPGVTG